MAPSEDELIAQYIEPNPYQSGHGDAWIVGYGVPVWAIIGAMHAAGTTDAIVKQTAAEYQLPIDAVRAAVAFYHRQIDVINARILANTVGA